VNNHDHTLARPQAGPEAEGKLSRNSQGMGDSIDPRGLGVSKRVGENCPPPFDSNDSWIEKRMHGIEVETKLTDA